MSKRKKNPEEMTLAELHTEAARQGVEGRSSMSRDELVGALSKDTDEPADKDTPDKPKPVEVPRTGDGEVDVKKWKESKREAPGEEPKPLEETSTRPVLIHPLPHVGGEPHEPGKEPPEPPEGAPEPTTPFPDAAAQRIYGLRKEGRLWRCRLTGHDTLLVECDTEKQAREAACTEWKHLAGESDEKKAQKKAAKEFAPAAMPALPPGFVAVPMEQAKVAPVKEENVRVVKLAP